MVLLAICSLFTGASLFEIKAGAVLVKFLVGAGEFPGRENGWVDSRCRTHILFQQSVFEIIVEVTDVSTELSGSQTQRISEIKLGLHLDSILIIKILKELRIKGPKLCKIHGPFLSVKACSLEQSWRWKIGQYL